LAVIVAAFLALGWALGFATAPAGAQPEVLTAMLKPSTLAAYNTYVRLTDARNAAELKAGRALPGQSLSSESLGSEIPLWVDGLAPAERTKAYERLKSGAVEMRKLETLQDGQAIGCPDGMIHHWVGAVFIPGATLAGVLGILEDYDHQAIYYAPDVERSRIESRDGDHFRVFLRFRRHKVITVVLNTEHDVQYFRDSRTGAHSRSSAVRISEVENAGKSDERERPIGDDQGFLWRMDTWWRMAERDGGVYVQSEAASLTRDIPTGLGWMVGPFVTSIPKETLAFTLEATRKAVTKAGR
jgi:hypothetical protein